MQTLHPVSVATLVASLALLCACGVDAPAGRAAPAPAAQSRRAASLAPGPQATGGGRSGLRLPRQPGGTPVAGSQPNSRASADTLQVSKCYTNATATSGGQMLIQARSSDPAARLFAYRPDGTAIGEVQNGGGSRYGGTVIA